MRVKSADTHERSEQRTVKNVQIRLSSQIHELLQEEAHSRRMSLADAVREALEVYLIHCAYSEEGKQLLYEDPKTGNRVEVVLPSSATGRGRFIWRKKEPAPQQT